MHLSHKGRDILFPKPASYKHAVSTKTIKYMNTGIHRKYLSHLSNFNQYQTTCTSTI